MMTLVAASLQHVASVWQTASTFTGKFLLLWVAMSAPLCAVQMMIIVAVVSIPFVFGPSRQQQYKPTSAKLDCHNCKKPLSRRSLSLVIFAGLVFVILPTIFITFGHLLLVCAVHKVAPHFKSLYFYSESSSTSFGSPHVAVDAYLHKSISTRIRSTRHGVLRGLLYQFSNENWGQLNATDVEVYLGIRYAAAPIGDFRFMPPSSSPSWTGVMNATEFGPACPQQVPNSRHLRQTGTPRARLEQIERLTPFLLNQSEDCLFLNIYTPVLSHNDLSPVVIFIHGESYEWNSGNAYDGSVLASYAQAVVITFNFRLGVLGYLSTGDDASRGNYALMDMLAAITWVRDNINVFGGDPTRITLMGHDSGAASASLLMSLPQTLSTTTSSSSSASSSSLAAVGNGAQQTLSLQRRAASSAAVGTTTTKASLFQRVILISGSALEPSAMSYNPVIYAKIIAEQFSCPTNVMRELVNCLQGLSVGDILQAQSTIRVPRFLTAFGPVVDGYFVTKPPEQLFSRRDPSDNPYCRFGLLFGVSSTAGMKYLTDEDFQRPIMDSQRQQRISRTLVRNLFTYHMEEILQAINFEYAGSSGTSAGGDNSARYQQVREQTVNMLGDALSAAPLVKAGSLHSSLCDSHHQLYSNSKPDTFFYVFNYHPQSERTTDDKPHPTFTSTMNRDERPLDSYQDELSYIFGAPLLKNSLLSPFARHSYTERDAVVSQGVMTYFGNFLVTGNPMKSADSTTNFRPHRQTSQRLSPPAEPVSRSHIRRRFIEHISWPPFTVNSSFVQSGTRSSAEGAYLSISLEPSVRSQYRQHYMSFWNDLVPQLNSADENNAFSALADNGHAPPPPSSLLPSFNHHNTAHSQHHLLSNFDDMSTYEGTVLPAAHILTAAQMTQYNTRSNSGNTKRMLAGSLNSGESLQTSGLGGNDLPASDWSVPGHNTSTTVESDGNFPGEHVSKPFRSSSINGSATASRANNATAVPSPLGSYTAYGAAAAVAVVVLCLAGCLIVCIRRQCQKCCDKTKRNDSNASSNDRAIAAFNSTSAGAAKPQQQQIANGKKSASLPNHYGNNHSNHYHAAHAKLLPNDDGELLRQTVPLESSLDNGQLPHVRAGNPSLRHNTATLPPPNSATVRNQMTIAAPSLTLDWANHNAPHNNRASLYAQQNGVLPNNTNQQLKLSYSLPGPQQKYWPAAANYLLNSENTAPTIVASTDSKHSHSSSDPQQHYEQQQGLVGARIAASASTAPLYFPAPLLQMSRSQHHRLNAGYPHPDHYQQSRSQQQSLFVQNHYTNQHPTTIATVGHLTSNDESWSANHQNSQSVSSSAQQFAPPHTNQIVANDHRQTGTTPTIAALSTMSNGSVLMKSKPPNAQLYLPAQSTASHNSSVDQNQRSAYNPADTHHQGAATSEFYETDFDNNALGQQRESFRRQHTMHLPNAELNNDTKSHHKARREDQQAVAAVANGHRPPSSGSAMLNGSSVDSNNNIDDTDETAV